ncbi:MAG: prepilin peptidase [Bacillota bacterium]
MLYSATFFFILGLIIGSFLNVVIYRLPRGETVIWGRSRCPACGHVLAWRDLVPVISYLALGGKCRYCGEAISPRYAAVELLTGAVFAGIYWHFGLAAELWKYLFLSCVLIAASFIDAEHYLIPDQLVAAGLVGGALFELGLGKSGILPSLLAGAAAGGILLLVIALSRGGMGLGDAKLAAVAGLFLGWPKALLALFFAVVAGGFVGALLVLLKRKGMKEALPFGPFISFGAVTALFWGENFLRWYMERMGLPM